MSFFSAILAAVVSAFTPLVADLAKFIFRCVVCNIERIITAKTEKEAVRTVQTEGWRGPRAGESKGWRCPCSP